MNSASVNELSCQQALALVAEYLDKELGPTERLMVDRHIETCRHCFGRFEFEQRLKDRLATLRSSGIPESLRKKVDSVLTNF